MAWRFRCGMWQTVLSELASQFLSVHSPPQKTFWATATSLQGWREGADGFHQPPLAKNVNAGSSSWSFASFLSKKRRDEVGNAFLTPIFASMPLDGQGARLPAGPAREATGIRPGRSAESHTVSRGSQRLRPCSSPTLTWTLLLRKLAGSQMHWQSESNASAG